MHLLASTDTTKANTDTDLLVLQSFHCFAEIDLFLSKHNFFGIHEFIPC